MDKRRGHNRKLRVEVEPSSTPLRWWRRFCKRLNRVPKLVRVIGAWFFLHLFDSFTAPFFDAVRDALMWFVRTLIGA